MATVNLSRQTSLQELVEIIKRCYPTYVCTIKGSRVNIDTGVHGKMEVFYTGKNLVVVPKINVIAAFILGLTIIGLVLIIIASNINPVAKEIANSIANDVNGTNTGFDSNSVVPDICPNCKNPNTKRIRLCEWCGGQIC
jgi:hypothetical protein